MFLLVFGISNFFRNYICQPTLHLRGELPYRHSNCSNAGGNGKRFKEGIVCSLNTLSRHRCGNFSLMTLLMFFADFSKRSSKCCALHEIRITPRTCFIAHVIANQMVLVPRFGSGIVGQQTIKHLFRYIVVIHQHGDIFVCCVHSYYHFYYHL